MLTKGFIELYEGFIELYEGFIELYKEGLRDTLSAALRSLFSFKSATS